MHRCHYGLHCHWHYCYYHYYYYCNFIRININIIIITICISVIYLRFFVVTVIVTITSMPIAVIINIMIIHYNDVIMGARASQITSLTIVYSTVYSDADLREHQSSASLAFVRGIHWWPVNSPHKWPVTREMFPFDDVMMYYSYYCHLFYQSLIYSRDL